MPAAVRRVGLIAIFALGSGLAQLASAGSARSGGAVPERAGAGGAGSAGAVQPAIFENSST